MRAKQKAIFIWRGRGAIFATLLLASFSIFLAAPLRASSSSNVKRSALERQGKAWVETLQSSAPAVAGGRLILRAAFGSIKIIPGAFNRVQCRVVLKAFAPSVENARSLLRAYSLKFFSSGQGIINVQSNSAVPPAAKSEVSADFQVTVPRAFQLNVMTGSGDIRIEAPIQGAVRAVTAGGNVRMDRASGAVRIETSGGNIVIGGAGGTVDARTAGGSIRVGNVGSDALLETSGGDIEAGKIRGRATMDTAGGDITLASAQGAVRAETSGGQIRIGSTAASVEAQSAGGSIFLKGSRGMVRVETAGGSINLFGLKGGVDARTASGSILAELVEGDHALQASHLVTTNGNVTVYIPSNLALSILALVKDTTGKAIGSDFPLKITGAHRGFAGGPVRAVGVVNGGGQSLQIESTGGGVRILTLNAKATAELKQREAQVWNR